MKELNKKEITSSVFGAGDCWGIDIKAGESSICIGVHVE